MTDQNITSLLCVENVDMARIVTPNGLGPVKRDELELLCGLETDPASAMNACLADMRQRWLLFDDGASP